MTPPSADDARAVWLLMSDFVIDNTRRREVADALGMSFGRTRAIRRLARGPMSMRELAAALSIDPPNATTVVADLEAEGLMRRTPHPTDGRAKVVELTPKGRAMAERASAILSAPPPELEALGAEELETLRQLFERLRG